MTEKPTIVVAVSGGVDSSVVSAMLKEQGYPVIAVMMHLWSEEGKECENKCCTPQAMEEARKSAQQLGIPFHVLDAADIFYGKVVQYFLDGYSSGTTPNPCVRCNREIKWGLLLEKAKELGGDYLATGHYLRREERPDGSVILRKAADAAKDQSYVMCMLNQDQLKHTIFPLGEYHKTEVREMARHYGLPMAEKPDSQDLCFVGADDYRAFLLRNAPQVAQPGRIVDRSGNVLGEHQGLAFYTTGQRKGIGIAAHEPLYVLEKKVAENLLVVGGVDELHKSRIVVKDVNWLLGDAPAPQTRAEVKIRYHSKPHAALIMVEVGNRAVIEFDEPVRDATPGQFAVFYDGDVLLGGGEII